MTRTFHVLLTLLLGAVLLTGAATAADTANWEFETTYLIQQNEQNYSFTGTDLLLPVNITGFSGENITRMEIIASVENGEGTDITDDGNLHYVYQLSVPASVKGSKESRPWHYAMAGAEIDGNGQILLLNISGLSEDAYTITLDITYGRGDQATAEYTTADISILIVDWLYNETWDNTLQSPTPEGTDAWNYTVPAEVCYLIIPNPNEGTYPSSVPFPVIARYNETGTYDLDTYPFALPLTPTNATIIVNKSDDKTTWIAVEGETNVVAGPDGNVSLTVAAEDVAAKWLKVSFIGKNLGDVMDMESDDDNSFSVMTDIDYILRTAATENEGEYSGPITENRYIYGDINADGKLTLGDGLTLFRYWKSI